MSTRLHRRHEQPHRYNCAQCGHQFSSTRSDAKLCSNACRQADWRRRTYHWALITWATKPRTRHTRSPLPKPRWSFYRTREEAKAAAAMLDEAYSIVDITRQAEASFPEPAEVAFRGLWMDERQPGRPRAM